MLRFFHRFPQINRSVTFCLALYIMGIAFGATFRGSSPFSAAAFAGVSPAAIALCFLMLLFFSAFSLFGVLIAAALCLTLGSYVSHRVVQAFSPFLLSSFWGALPLALLVAPALLLLCASCMECSVLFVRMMSNTKWEGPLRSNIGRLLLVSGLSLAIVCLYSIVIRST